MAAFIIVPQNVSSQYTEKKENLRITQLCEQFSIAKNKCYQSKMLLRCWKKNLFKKYERYRNPSYYTEEWYFSPFFLDSTALKSKPCSSSPCKNDGTCSEFGQNLFNCICPEGFTGPRCTQGRFTYSRL